MNSQLRKNLVFNTAGSLLFYVCQAAMNLLVTALAGAAANGLLATAMTIANVGLSFASYGMRTFQVSDEAGKYTDRTYLASRFVTVALAWAACMGFAFVNAYTSRQRWVIFLYTGYRLVESASDVWHGFLQKAERMDIVGISFGVRGVFTAGAVVGGLLLTRDLVITECPDCGRHKSPHGFLGVCSSKNLLFLSQFPRVASARHRRFRRRSNLSVLSYQPCPGDASKNGFSCENLS